ncbi:MAG: cytochrome c [Candidatus Sericytochromatia bacterium]
MTNKKLFSMAFSAILASSLVFSTAALAGGNAKDGKKIYDQNCTTCHGPKGKGDGAASAALNPKPRNFAEGKFKYGKTDAELVKFIKTGKGPMPPWGGVLKDKQIEDVLAYIKTLKK